MEEGRTERKEKNEPNDDVERYFGRKTMATLRLYGLCLRPFVEEAIELRAAFVFFTGAASTANGM